MTPGAFVAVAAWLAFVVWLAAMIVTERER